MRPILVRVLHGTAVFLAIHLGAASATAAEAEWSTAVRFSWQQTDGVVLQTPAGTVLLDRGPTAGGPVLRFLGKGVEQRLSSPQIERIGRQELLLRYAATGPEESPIEVVRHIRIALGKSEAELVEEFTLVPSKTISSDLEIERPFSLRAVADKPEAIFPLYNGWARSYALGSDLLRGQWQLGNVMRDVPSQQLSLPVVQVGQQGKWMGAICADPYFGSLYELSVRDGQVFGSVRYRYAGSKVPLAAGQKEVRRFGVWLADAKPDEPFGRSIDAFFRLMVPDVPPGPKWLHGIAMVGFDFLSDNGQGWEKDVKELARLLSPAERRRVVLCFHGWYETIGGYSYDDGKREMKPEWVAMGRTRKAHFTQDEVRRRLKLARDLGFRVLLYFADGLLQDSGAPGYRPEWDCVDEQGNKIGGWIGPDTWGQTFARNPAHPQVSQWYKDYLAALLRTFGPVVDGFVWDESYYVRVGVITRTPQPAYCDRAMMELMRTLTQLVHATDAEKVLLSSDEIGWHVPEAIFPAYGIVSNGVFQDSQWKPDAWLYNLFPNWRNVLWGCHWFPISQFARIRWGVENFGLPVPVSNGWGDDVGPSEWTLRQREATLRLFRQRLAQKERVRYVGDDPAKLLATSPDQPAPSDPLPAPAAGEVNWALASNGGRATASSSDDTGDRKYPPSGAIDGKRDDQGWGQGHGWASKAGEALPQWLEVQFLQPRDISRFVVVTFQSAKALDKPAGPDTAAKWGVTDYALEIWDETARQWKAVVRENRGQIKMARVHSLDKPVRTGKFRIVVSQVAPLDGVARLLQLEAWGKEGTSHK